MLKSVYAMTQDPL